MQATDIRILSEPRPVEHVPRPAPNPQEDPRRVAWRWRYRDPESGDMVDPSDLMTPAEMLAIDPQAELIPGTRTLLPAPATRLWW